MILNTTYAEQAVGTGVYTRNLQAALPEAGSVRLPAALLGAGGARFWAKRAAEVALGARPGTVVHPYWAPDASTRHIVSVLDFVQYREATRVERALLDRTAARSDVVLVLSRHVVDQVEWARPRVVVAPPFPDDAWFETPVTPRRTASDGRLRIGYFGGWHARKGMPDFLDVLGRSALADDVEVHCTGRPPNSGQVRVVARGHLSTAETVALADACDVVVYPSSEEGYGLPVVEALLRERPVLCRDLPPYAEFVGQPDALHVPTSWDDPSELARSIEAAVAAPTLPRHRALRHAERSDAVARLRAAALDAVGVVA